VTNEPPPPSRRLTAICAYVVLLLLGAAESVTGCFQYSRGPGPVLAVGFALGILLTCLLAGWGMQSALGGLMPGAGWLATSFALATGTQGGSVLITNTMAGEWFLFGGSVCAAGGCLVAYLRWSRLSRTAGGRWSSGAAGR